VLDSENRYDQVLYPGRAYLEAHPDRLATCARLLGLAARDPERCRLLELGCGNGTHLIALAQALPDSEFVGIDASERAIGMARELAAEVGLTNVAFEQADLASLDAGARRFDYVTSHGVYSWVPPEVQDALLVACGKHLAPEGVAYVSYATYPGAYARALVRDMMLFHAGQIQDPIAKVKRGIEFVHFVRAAQPANSALGATLDVELKRLDRGPLEYVFHDDFSEHSAPVYFGAFVAHAAASGLQFLCEANYDLLEIAGLPDGVRSSLRELSGGDRIAEQQYLDFVVDTAFRRTLLCSSEAQISPNGVPERLLGLHAASSLRPEGPVDATSTAPTSFVGQFGERVETEGPLAKAALLLLCEAWPGALPIGELFERALRLAELSAERDGSDLLAAFARLLLRLAALKAVSVHVRPPRFAATVSERPCASPLARVQARRGMLLTSLRHQQIRLEDAISRELLQLLDGSRTRAELLAELERVPFATREPGAAALELGAGGLETSLARMARDALLVA